MKLRKNEIKVPMNFPIPLWRFPVFSIGNSDFLGSRADRYDLIGNRSARKGSPRDASKNFPALENERLPRGADD